MNKTLIVARTEIIKHLRKPSFWFTLVLIPVLMGITTVLNSSTDSAQSLPGLAVGDQQTVDTKPEDLRVGVVDHAGIIATIPADLPAETRDLYRLYPDDSTAATALQATEVSAYYVIPAGYLADGTVRRYSRSIDLFGGAVQEQLVGLLIRTSLLGDASLPAARAMVDPTALINMQSLEPVGDAVAQQNLQEREQKAFQIGYLFSMLLYMGIFFSASWLLAALIDEKENRVIEVVLSSLRPRQLLMGKVLGLGLLGLGELLLWLLFGRLLLNSGVGSMVSMDLTLGQAALAVVCFLFGYLVYASLMAGIGAVANTMRETSQLTVAVAFPLIVPLVFMSLIVSQPNGTLATALSLFPLTAPVVLLVRHAVIGVPLWQIGLSVVLMALTAWGMQLLAARMFRATTLLTGTRPSFKAFWNALRG